MKTNYYRFCYFFYFLLILLFTHCKHDRVDPPIPDLQPGFTVNDFSKSPILDIMKNCRVKGSTMAMAYTEEDPEAEMGTTQHFEISKGFESTFTFAGQPGNYLQIRLHAMDESIYNPYGISNVLEQNVFNLGHTITKTVTNKPMPSLFDGKKHIVKIQTQNILEQGLLTKIFIDDMNQAAFVGEDSTEFDRKKLYTIGPLANRRVSLLFFGNGPKEGEVVIYNWSFKPL